MAIVSSRKVSSSSTLRNLADFLPLTPLGAGDYAPYMQAALAERYTSADHMA